MNKSEIEQLAGRLLAGDLSVEEFSRQIRHCGIANVGDAQLDLDRGRRCGFPEVVYSQGKTVAALEKIFDALLEHGVHVLATRMAPDQAAELLPRFARTSTIHSPGRSVFPPHRQAQTGKMGARRSPAA